MEDWRLFIIGNGFDLAHGMATRYGDFNRWLIKNERYDVIQELQSAYPAKMGNDFLLWSDFEAALGQYDIEKVFNWSWEDLLLTEVSIGGQRFDNPQFFLETQLNEIINSAFSAWAREIILASHSKFIIPIDADGERARTIINLFSAYIILEDGEGISIYIKKLEDLLYEKKSYWVEVFDDLMYYYDEQGDKGKADRLISIIIGLNFKDFHQLLEVYDVLYFYNRRHGRTDGKQSFWSYHEFLESS